MSSVRRVSEYSSSFLDLTYCTRALLSKPVDCVLLGVSGRCVMVYHVALCAPYILAGIVFEIDKGTRVLTHSPNAIHKRRQYRRYQPNISGLLSIFSFSNSKNAGTQQQLFVPYYYWSRLWKVEGTASPRPRGVVNAS